MTTIMMETPLQTCAIERDFSVCAGAPRREVHSHQKMVIIVRVVSFFLDLDQMTDTISRGEGLRETAFSNRRLARLGVEVMTLESLWRRVPRQKMARPERVDFFMLLLVERGRGTHMVDFTAFPLQSRSLVFVQPGQVQQWNPHTGLKGLMLMVDPPVMNPDTTRSALQHTLAREWQSWPVNARLPASAEPAVRQWFIQLTEEVARFDDTELSIAMMRSLMSCLLLQVARIHSQAAVSVDRQQHNAPALLRLLRSAIEDHLRARPTVQVLASELGYSVSTLNRACLATEGRSAKAVIDHRVALEAKRLLVHSRDAAGQIGVSLGFSEPTNFLKFFKRVVGCTPDAFRQKYTRTV
ncbi:MAG: helix-turn-helix domain-containing protein [Burkholderiales bacterium]|nr:helix-turn-helix domain-containing protein [Burkholderiales bacterium]MDE2276226.1 helix-turn-helix domain-containing protein [Burkholderiales bacterium]